MVSPYIFNRVASKLAIAMLAGAAMVSCGTVYELYAPPGATVHPPQIGNYENPDKYRVPESERKTYVATKTFSPPRPREGSWTSKSAMADIEPGDVWSVTHRVQSRLVVFSVQYQARQKQLLAGKGNYLYSLLIDTDGRVNKGWLLLRDPKLVVLASERMTIMDPSIRDTDGWPSVPVFALNGIIGDTRQQ